MHSSSFDQEASGKDGGDVLVAIATLVTEGRIPGQLNSKSKKFFEGPHCQLTKPPISDHKCDLTDSLCAQFDSNRETVLRLWEKNIPVCIEVQLTCACGVGCGSIPQDSISSGFLLEQWYFDVTYRRHSEPLFFNLPQLISAIRSQLYFSQITAWLTTQDETTTHRITKSNLHYRLTIPGETYETSKFSSSAIKHDFPATDIGNGLTLTVHFLSLPRMSQQPNISCAQCVTSPNIPIILPILDDRMHTSCKMKGKHRCEDYEEVDNEELNTKKKVTNFNKRVCHSSGATTTTTSSGASKPEKRNISPDEEGWRKVAKNDLNLNKGQLLLDAIERSGQLSSVNDEEDDSDRDKAKCDMSASDIFSIKQTNNRKHCDSPIPTLKHKQTGSAILHRRGAKQRLFFDEEIPGSSTSKPSNKDDIPTASEQAKFRKNLGNAASMVFHSRTGLPLTSSPAPVRRGKSCFDFDSSINSVSAIKSALFSSSFSTDDDSESDGGIVSPCSPDTYVVPKHQICPVKYRRKGTAANLLGSFEESVLNGRLEPVSTVHGFTAELGASGSFVPKHLVVPVTVFFYTLGDNDKVSSPYLSHINLGKKGYNVPKSGTVQVTLFNPLGTVVKMFVIMYDLSDMPPSSQTFIRQRTLYMPTNCRDNNIEWGPKWLRYLIHLRFMSSKSGKIYLHSDIRMIIFRKCDMDTATAHGLDMSYELRSFTHQPTNPRFSPRK